MKHHALGSQDTKHECRVRVSKTARNFFQSENRARFLMVAGNGFRYVLVLFLSGLIILTTVTGCSKKTVRNSSMVFNLDDVFKKRSDSNIDPELHQKWKETALELARAGELKEAIEAFEKYIEQDPENYFGFNGLAVCYKKMKNPVSAMTNFDRALEFADEPAERAKILGNIGNLYLDTNQLKTALGHYREAANVYKKQPYYLILIAFTFLKQGQPDRAQKVLAQAERKISRLKELDQSEQGKAYYYMARCILGTGEQDQERVYRYLKLALKADPKHLVPRLKKDVNNGESLFYTLKDEKDFVNLISQYSEDSAKSIWNKKEQSAKNSPTRFDSP